MHSAFIIPRRMALDRLLLHISTKTADRRLPRAALMCQTARGPPVAFVSSRRETFMMKRVVGTVSLAIALLFGIGGMACVHSGQRARANHGHETGSVDARQRGYDFASRDGADRGRADRARTNPHCNFNGDDCRNSDRGYSRSFGNRGQYQRGYRGGCRAGCDDV